MTALYLFLSAVLVLTPLVALHEWGHYIVARWCGVKVLTYSIGFGPKIASWTSKKTGTNYRLSAILLGGYVKMLDEREGSVADDEKHLAFNNQHPLKKMAIVLAGPLMNFIIAFGLFFVLFMTPTQTLSTHIAKVEQGSPAMTAGVSVGDKIVAVDGKAVKTWQDIGYRLTDRMGETGSLALTVEKQTHANVTTYALPINNFMHLGDTTTPNTDQSPFSLLGVLPYRPHIPAVIGELVDDGAGALMGLKAGDEIVQINDTPINDWTDATDMIRQNPETMLSFSVMRDGKKQTIEVMPQGKSVGGRIIGQIGARVRYNDDIAIPSQYRQTVSYTPIQAVGQAMTQTYELSAMTLKSMGKMLTGILGLDTLSGPITIAQVSQTSLQMGWMQVLSTAALISVSLAVLNLLPIPVLDGGHMVYYAYELIAGKPLSERVQMVGLNIGMMLLLGFMLVAIGNDLTRVFG